MSFGNFGIITEDMAKCHPLCLKLLNSTHTLIAGTTGSGKSVMMNSMIYTAMRMPVDSLYFVDLKKVEFKAYKKLLKTAWYCDEPYQVVPMLDSVIKIMDKRYRRMKKRMFEGDPTFIFIDELADLVCLPEGKAILERLIKIGRLGRAANIHLICATQDPSRHTIPAYLVQNFTARLALRCVSPIESRQIIGEKGAELLPLYGKGILRDARGLHEVDIPFTPDEDIQKMASAVSDRAWYLNFLCRCFGIEARTVEKNYWQRVIKGTAQW